MATSDPLLRPAAPVDVLVIGRAELQAAVDAAVALGHITAPDAAALVQELVARGIPAPAEVAAPELAIRPLPPIAGYDELTSGEVAERLQGLDPAQLRQLRDYERRNANRKSVLDAVAARLG
jgi:hypothetical protein